MAKHKQKLEVEKKVEQQLAYIQRKTDEYDRKSKERIRQLDEMVYAAQEKSNVNTTITIVCCVVGVLAISFVLWILR